MEQLSKVIRLALLLLGISSSVWEEGRALAGMNEVPVLQIACSNSVLHLPTNIFLGVHIINNSSNVVALAQPISDFRKFEVEILDAAGRSFRLESHNAAGPNGGTTAMFELRPGTTFDCAIAVPLKSGIKPGRYRLQLERWYLVLFLGPNGKAQSDRRCTFVSNLVPIEIR